MILHTVNKSPFNHKCLQDCLSVMAEDDALLLLEDGVYGAMAGYTAAAQLKVRCDAGLRLYAIGADLAARGLSQKIVDFADVIDYDRFVQLTTEYHTTLSWY